MKDRRYESTTDDYIDDYDDLTRLHEGVCGCETCVNRRVLEHGGRLLDDKRDPIGGDDFEDHFFHIKRPDLRIVRD